jgi:hypothetical protein
VSSYDIIGKSSYLGGVGSSSSGAGGGLGFEGFASSLFGNNSGSSSSAGGKLLGESDSMSALSGFKVIPHSPTD